MFNAFENFIYRKNLTENNFKYLQEIKDFFVAKLRKMPFENTETGILILDNEKISMDLEIAI